MRYSVLCAAFILSIWPVGAIYAEQYCVSSKQEFHSSLKQAFANHQDDVIKIVAGTDIGKFKIKQEPGYSLSIEGGYDRQCIERVIRAPEINAEFSGSGGDVFETGDEQSTTGPVPPPEVSAEKPEVDGKFLSAAGGTIKVIGAPGYAWRHGCGPTAVGMILGYYDIHGFRDLFPGSAATQTPDVNQGIASQRNSSDPGHYEDYSLPIDNYPNLYADKSALPAGDEHPDDCVADFMETSFSSRSNRYGWSWSNDIIPSFTGYVNLRHPAFNMQTGSYRMSNGTLTWAVMTNQIGNDHPMVFLVDTNSDGSTDHFVTIVGYNDATGEYGCLDTWSPYDEVRWCDFAAMASGRPWGIWGGWSLVMLPPDPGDIDYDGDVDLNDALMSLQVVAGMAPSAHVYDMADVDGDGKIGMEDAACILQDVTDLR